MYLTDHNRAKESSSSTSRAFAEATTVTVSIPASSTSNANVTPFGITSTSSATNSAPSVVPLDCPNINGTKEEVILKTSSWNFLVTCGIDWEPSGDYDIIAFASYSIHDCAQACASYNLEKGQNICKGASFNSGLAYYVANYVGNCHLKNRTQEANRNGDNRGSGLTLVT